MIETYLAEELDGELCARLSIGHTSAMASGCVDELGPQPPVASRPLGPLELRAQDALLDEAQGAARVQHLVRR